MKKKNKSSQFNVNIEKINSKQIVDFKYQNQNNVLNSNKPTDLINQHQDIWPNTTEHTQTHNGPHSKIINYNSEMISTIYRPDTIDYNMNKPNKNGAANLAYVATSNISLNNYPTNEFSIKNHVDMDYIYNEKGIDVDDISSNNFNIVNNKNTTTTTRNNQINNTNLPKINLYQLDNVDSIEEVCSL